nr:amidinotransferase [Leadbetterella sp.]
EVLAAWKKQMNYDLVTFNAFDQSQHPIYHTNVVMCMGDTFCVICLESIFDLDERLLIKQKLEGLGKEVIEISLSQMNEFAGNMLLLKNKAEKKFLVMSDRAFKSLTKHQIDFLEDYAEIIHPDLGVIETYGGGSARCMIAEIHLPEI